MASDFEKANPETGLEPQSPSEDQEPGVFTEAVPIKFLHVYNSKWLKNLTVTNDAKEPVYFVENSLFTFGKPEVTLHAGADSTSPILGACKFPCFTSNVQ